MRKFISHLMDELFTALTNHGFWLSQFNSIGGQLSQIPCAGTCALYFSMLKVFGIAKEGKNNNNNKIKKNSRNKFQVSHLQLGMLQFLCFIKATFECQVIIVEPLLFISQSFVAGLPFLAVFSTCRRL